MQISKKSKETIDACRFCWMCRHICPIGNATGQERNTARARALSLSLVERGAAELKGDIVDNVYECSLCGGCTKDCLTGWDPVAFTKETRLEAALNGALPEYIEKLIENIEKTGNVYGAKKIDSKLKASIAELPKKADILLFLGKDVTYNSPKNAILATQLLKKAGVNFTVLEDEPDSGYAYDFLIGAADETKKTMTDTAKKLDYKKIVAYDPADAKVFLREYKEWNIGLKSEVVTFTSFISDLIKKGVLKVKNNGEEYTFQDSSLLSR
ncbi:MAG: (Fe-S)-binding protein, partial [Bacillota bacterium]|nr:(Fe-S)-binding protein [Bacillota bacterium]